MSRHSSVASGGPNDVETAVAEADAALGLAAKGATSYADAEAVFIRTLKTLDGMGSRVPARIRASVESGYAALAQRFGRMRGAASDAMETWRQAVRVARARVDMEQGLYGQTLQQLDGLPDRAYMMNAVALMRGASLCNTGNVAAGLAHLRPYLAEREKNGSDYAFSPWLAYDQAQVGPCELRAGHRTIAATLAAKAKTAFVGQPNVSPFFKHPSEALSRQLRQSAIGDRQAA